MDCSQLEKMMMMMNVWKVSSIEKNHDELKYLLSKVWLLNVVRLNQRDEMKISYDWNCHE